MERNYFKKTATVRLSLTQASHFRLVIFAKIVFQPCLPTMNFPQCVGKHVLTHHLHNITDPQFQLCHVPYWVFGNSVFPETPEEKVAWRDVWAPWWPGNQSIPPVCELLVEPASYLKSQVSIMQTLLFDKICLKNAFFVSFLLSSLALSLTLRSKNCIQFDRLRKMTSLEKKYTLKLIID